ncbi:hypothetical protein G2W53_021063 [Senna tora]|uniref:Uncharacterized protein n=1 Tax=Senna tora TaxID=362788 RepID=A0A834WN43_9FABA|nr:hypothetical protein G2W53_021063 [Senna tora]
MSKIGLDGKKNESKVHSDGPTRERVALRGPSVLLVGCPESADERVEAAPRLPQRARARGGRLGLTVEHAAVHVDLGLPELVEVA